MNGRTHLSTWVSAEIKARFGAVAAHLGLSESALLKRLVELNLQSARAAAMDVLPPPDRVSRGARLSVRLRAEDELMLRERASVRGMAVATYVSVLVRAHLRALTPIPDRELAQLERAVSALGIIGCNLIQIARVASQTGRAAGPGPEHLQAMLRVCTALREHFKAFISANRRAWESGNGKTAG